MTDKKVKKLFEGLKGWHSTIVNQLQLAIESDANIQLQDSNGRSIKLSNEKSEQVKIGLSIAHDMIKDFPLTIKENNDKKVKEIYLSLCDVAQGYPVRKEIEENLRDLELIDYKTMRAIHLTEKGLNYILTYE